MDSSAVPPLGLPSQSEIDAVLVATEAFLNNATGVTATPDTATGAISLPPATSCPGLRLRHIKTRLIGTRIRPHFSDSDSDSDADEDRPNASYSECNHFGCNTKLVDPYAMVSHKVVMHRLRCTQCMHIFPTGYLLDLHIQEQHDPLFAVHVERKRPVFRCVLRTCEATFCTPAERKEHGIREHHMPANFPYFPAAGQKQHAHKGKSQSRKGAGAKHQGGKQEGGKVQGAKMETGERGDVMITDDAQVVEAQLLKAEDDNPGELNSQPDDCEQLMDVDAIGKGARRKPRRNKKNRKPNNDKKDDDQDMNDTKPIEDAAMQQDNVEKSTIKPREDKKPAGKPKDESAPNVFRDFTFGRQKLKTFQAKRASQKCKALEDLSSLQNALEENAFL